MTDLYIPIFDSIDSDERKVVGIMSSLVHWKSFFRYVLPQNIHGINAVLEYTCKGTNDENNASKDGPERLRRRATENFLGIEVSEALSIAKEEGGNDRQDGNAVAAEEAASAPTESPKSGFTISIAAEDAGTPNEDEATNEIPYVTSEQPQDIRGETKQFTIVIEGVEAYAVGHGDLHERKFHKYERRASYVGKSDFRDGEFRMNDGTYMGVPIDNTCTYELRVYPSQQFYDQYSTSTPLTITLVIAFVFLFAIFVFWVYNLMVEQRQKKILRKATQTTALVSTLFPKNVRDRYESVISSLIAFLWCV